MDLKKKGEYHLLVYINGPRNDASELLNIVSSKHTLLSVFLFETPSFKNCNSLKSLHLGNLPAPASDRVIKFRFLNIMKSCLSNFFQTFFTAASKN